MIINNEDQDLSGIDLSDDETDTGVTTRSKSKPTSAKRKRKRRRKSQSKLADNASKRAGTLADTHAPDSINTNVSDRVQREQREQERAERVRKVSRTMIHHYYQKVKIVRQFHHSNQKVKMFETSIKSITRVMAFCS